MDVTHASFCVINDFVAFELMKYQCKVRLREKNFVTISGKILLIGITIKIICLCLGS